MSRLNYIEIRDAFPEGKQIVNRLIKNKKIVMDTFAMEIREIIKDPYMNETDKMFDISIIEHIHLPKLISEYNRLKKYAFFYQNKSSGEYVLKVENARNVKIEDIVETKVRQTGARKATAPCPLHKETKNSFHIYKDTNSFYCFGCCQGGDVIHFVKLMYDLDFKDAVRFLNEYK